VGRDGAMEEEECDGVLLLLFVQFAIFSFVFIGYFVGRRRK